MLQENCKVTLIEQGGIMLGEKGFERFLYKILLLDYIKDDYALEFQNASIKIVVGSILFSLGPFAFDKYPETFQYVQWLDARFWGMLFILVGSVHLYGLFKRKRVLRKNVLLLAGTLWTWFGLSIWFANWMAFNPYIYFFFALSSFRCYLCIHVFKRFELHVTAG
jgi:hypothetical protein